MFPPPNPNWSPSWGVLVPLSRQKFVLNSPWYADSFAAKRVIFTPSGLPLLRGVLAPLAS